MVLKEVKAGAGEEGHEEERGGRVQEHLEIEDEEGIVQDEEEKYSG